MSPEVAAGQREIDRRADVYSLAVLAYRLLVGQLPFTGDPYRVLQAQINDPPPIPSNVEPSLFAALDDVLLRGLAKQPATRYQTAGAFAAALASALANSDVGQQSATDALAELVRSVVRTTSTGAACSDDGESESSALADPTITILPRLPKADVPIFRPRARHRVRILLFGLATGVAVGIIVALVRH
jgi:serine/threonine-protein kinase